MVALFQKDTLHDYLFGKTDNFAVLMEDSYRHKGMRRQLVKVLRSKGITNENVLAAVGKIPRHFFLRDSALLEHAYQDKAFPIGESFVLVCVF